ncbi:hypothetical protein DPMN_144731 [Dreissena polymorpha]|uniref:Uncharacterized protein n=1 Tax=Dreissena polymorpha TaxID=45954 RepID=A0A9D4F5B6_DREPO|nr:hypothetical protein DPMN_144731 [Dreissena polymorpha]
MAGVPERDTDGNEPAGVSGATDDALDYLLSNDESNTVVIFRKLPANLIVCPSFVDVSLKPSHLTLAALQFVDLAANMECCYVPCSMIVPCVANLID